MRIAVAVAVISICALLLSGYTPAAQTTIRIGVQNFDYFPLYDFTDEQNSSLIEMVVARWAQNREINIEFVPMPAKRLEHEFFVNQRVDWIFPANPRWFKQYQTPVIYSTPVVTTLSGTMVLKNRPMDDTSWFTSLSVPFGFTPVKYEELIEQRNIVVFHTPTAEMALQMVLVEHVTGADVEYNVAQHYLSKWPDASPMTIAPLLPRVLIDFHLAAVAQQRWLEDFNQWQADNPEFMAAARASLNIIEHWPDD